MSRRVLRGLVEAWAPEVRSSASIIGVTGFLMATSKTINSGRVDNDASILTCGQIRTNSHLIVAHLEWELTEAFESSDWDNV